MASNDQGDKKTSAEAALDPVSRMSEILFGLLMVLTFTGTFSVVNAGESSVRELLIASLGCNLAWGLVDGCMLLLNRLAERGHACASGCTCTKRRLVLHRPPSCWPRPCQARSPG